MMVTMPLNRNILPLDPKMHGYDFYYCSPSRTTSYLKNELLARTDRNAQSVTPTEHIYLDRSLLCLDILEMTLESFKVLLSKCDQEINNETLHRRVQ